MRDDQALGILDSFNWIGGSNCEMARRGLDGRQTKHSGAPFGDSKNLRSNSFGRLRNKFLQLSQDKAFQTYGTLRASCIKQCIFPVASAKLKVVKLVFASFIAPKFSRRNFAKFHTKTQHPYFRAFVSPKFLVTALLKVSRNWYKKVTREIGVSLQYVCPMFPTTNLFITHNTNKH